MDIYIIGGAIRDILRGETPNDIDYVVVNATEDEMINLGFRSVGEDFPVFLHPTTGDEYAMARRERKSGTGYSGFDTDTDNVTLEEDTARRDLTINTLAVKQCDWEEFEKTGDISLVIDNHSGLNDMINKVLRNVTDAYREDPVRTLRVARFRARLGPEWSVAERTVELIKIMHDDGEYNSLTRERVWKEVSNAMMEPHAQLFVKSLKDWGILDVIFGANGCNGIVKSLPSEFEYTRLISACDRGASLPVRLAMAGFNSDDVRQIKGDTDIVKFIHGLYQVTLHLSDLHDGVEIVNIFNSVNAYQNLKNYEWLLESIGVLHGQGAQDLFKIVYELSKKYGFDQLSDDIKAGDPKQFKKQIDIMRSKVITVYCSDAVEVIRKKHPDLVAEVEQE